MLLTPQMSDVDYEADEDDYRDSDSDNDNNDSTTSDKHAKAADHVEGDETAACLHESMQVL